MKLRYSSVDLKQTYRSPSLLLARLWLPRETSNSTPKRCIFAIIYPMPRPLTVSHSQPEVINYKERECLLFVCDHLV
jgi:hypothetical protein